MGLYPKESWTYNVAPRTHFHHLTNSFVSMERLTRLTWATPVEAHILGASLEAYVESKASITTFKLCAQHGKSSLAPVSTLPAELLNLVAGYIERSFFDEHISVWEESMNCVEKVL